MRLHIPFSEISEHGVHIAITDHTWLPDEFPGKVDAVSVDLQLTKKSESRIEIHGDLKVVVKLVCDRCLIDYKCDIANTMQLIVELPDSDRHWRMQDIERTSDELDTLQVSEPVVDLKDILCQQLFLLLPTKQLCTENCMGLCIHCGCNLNKKQCRCQDDNAANSPFAVLASYKKKKN